MRNYGRLSANYRRLLFIGVALFALLFSLNVRAISGRATPNNSQITQHSLSQRLDNLQQQLEIAERNGDIANQGIALSNMALALQKQGKWQLAREKIDRGLFLLESLSPTQLNQKSYAQALDIQGKLFSARGDFTSALETWKKSGKIYQNFNLEQESDRNIIYQVQGMKELALYQPACHLINPIILEKIRRSAENHEQNFSFCTGDITDEMEKTEIAKNLQTLERDRMTAKQLQLLGDILRLSRNLNLSELAIESGLNMATQLGDDKLIESLKLSLGNLFRAQGDRAIARARSASSEIRFNFELCPTIELNYDAKNAYQKAVEAYNSIAKNDAIALQAKLNLLRLSAIVNSDEKLLDNPSAIVGEIDTITARNPLLFNSQFGETLFLNTIQTKTCLKSNEKIPDLSWENLEKQLQTISEISKTRQDWKTQSYALGYLGRIDEFQDKLSEAKAVTEQALSLSQSLNLNAPELAYQWQWQLGRILTKSNSDRQQVIAAYQAAFNTLQSLRQELVSSNRDLQFSFRDAIEPMYRTYVDLLLQSAEPTQEDLTQARDVIEALQLSELDDFFNDPCLMQQNIPLDDIIPSDTAVLYPILLDDKIAIIYRLPNEEIKSTVQLIENAEMFSRSLAALLGSAKNHSNAERYLTLSQNIYPYLFPEHLLTDLESDPNINTLVFVLDGQLRNIPMALLHDGERYLIEKYAVVVAPGLSLLAPHQLSSRDRQPLLGGLTEIAPSFRDVEDRFSPLVNAWQELNSIREIFDREVDLIVNEDFTPEVIETNTLQRYFPIFHWVTHAQFSSDLDETFIFTWEDKLKIEDLRQLIQANNNSQQKNIDLLVLSACQTAEGDNRATLGLAGVAVRAGSQSTLATLWEVNDKSTTSFMTEFYRQLIREKKSKAQALQAAQLSLLQDTIGQGLTHPEFWAAFVLVGDWL
ncbi:CHAT domain-containing protein [Roseofilum casamattae]|uniref:CHAT domain-containing protein n=1 Tax=Roseofilum casamattae BLCC-M143 TaxID=3022442 RepID=A0ABT7BZ02_9CYAN|nr:CHAT domain-containing protein [Roseofilum casamattae]MDJ1184434.1 CHAT domain-containing protein [Roseofilum casamattae BLCC-M143]